MSKYNTIYIISYGRPNCLTAQTLKDINYKGDWFIVVGDNDDKLDEYINNWGEDKVIVFDFNNAFNNSDMLDNLGLSIPSGDIPVRNEVQRISKERGELRFWELDDDITSFYIKHPIKKFNIRLNGDLLEKYFNIVSKYAYDVNLNVCGFSTPIESRPETMFLKGFRVYNVLNLSSEDDKFIKFRGRLCSDIIQAIDTCNNGRYNVAFRFLSFNMPVTESLDGGNTNLFISQGLERKAGYGVMVNPLGVKLSYDYGRLHHYINWNCIKPMIIDDKWRK